MKIIHGPDFKLHLILDNSIFEDVLGELQNRFGEVFIADEKPLFMDETGKMIWDAGGSIVANDIKFQFRLDENVTLMCRSQHWDTFKKTIASAAQNERNGYFKLHSHMFCLCLTEEQISKLMLQIIKCSARCDQIAEVTMGRFPESNVQ